MLILPQIGFGKQGVQSDAVRLWDGVNVSNKTRLYAQTPSVLTADAPIKPKGTTAFWVHFNGVAPSYHQFVDTWQNGSDSRGLSLRFNGSSLNFDWNENGYNSYFTVSIDYNVWNWFCFEVNYVFSGSYIRLIHWDGYSFSYSYYGINNIGGSPAFERGYLNFNDYNGNHLPLSLYDFWHSESVIDMSNINNRRKFINDAGNPKYLGKNGEKPTGSPARLFFSGNFSNWKRNKGSLLLANNNELIASTPANFTKSPNKPL